MRPFLLLCLLFLSIAAFSQAKRAISLIDKSKIEEAYELLNRALGKDSLASAEKYVLAGLFFNQDFDKHNIDSAYHYILKAIEAYDYTTEKYRAKLANNGFNTETFGQLKKEIEKSGFIRAKNGGQEQDYIDFLKWFSTSTHVDSAVILRNIEAFTIAENINTFQSYKHFFETYPQAVEAKESQKRYEHLLFVNETEDGKLNSYQKFLKEYPDTWHRNEAEQVIYNIITGRNSVAAYREFVELYPQSHLNKQALILHYSLLDGLCKEQFLTTGLFSPSQLDSIRMMERLSKKLIFPIIHNGEYQLIDANNNIILSGLININQQNKCTGGISSYLLTTIEDEESLINLKGDVLAEGDIVSLIDEGMGMIKIISPEDQFFVNIGGFRTNNNTFSKASIVQPYIAFSHKTKWGLESITGIPILEAKYDSISSFHDIIILNRGKKWAIFPVNHFYPVLDGAELRIKLTLDNVLTLSEDRLLLEDGKKSSLVDGTGEVIIPFAEQSIELVDRGYFIDRLDSILDSRLADKWYYNIRYNETWTVGESHDTKDIYFKGQLVMNAEEVQIVGLSVAVVTSGDSTFCFFNDSTKVLLKANETVQPTRRMGQNSSVRHFIFTDSKGKKKVYNTAGKLISVGKIDKLIDIGDDYILSRVKNAYNLLDESGKVILASIDAAASLGNGYISFLSDKKFGLFNARDSTLVEAKYSRPLVNYIDTLFVTARENKYGIISRGDSLLIPEAYNEIRYLNDSIAILNNNFRWIFWDIKHGNHLLNNISDYWTYDVAGQQVYKIFKGIGYGIWTPELGLVLNSTYSEISIVTKGEEVVYIAEKSVEEADIIIMLYYNKEGKLFRKEILSTAEYEDLTCKSNQE